MHGNVQYLHTRCLLYTSCTLCGDLGELTGGGKKELLCELELELQAGEEADVQAFAKTLAERFHLHEQPRSKLQRARARCV